MLEGATKAKLRIPRDASEAVLGHVAPGIVGVYDQYNYFDEKRRALEAWAAKLHSIAEPTPADNVVPLPLAASR